MQALYQFDCLRANKSTMAWGVEARVPFLDRAFLDVAMAIDPSEKMIDKSKGRIEKYILRKAGGARGGGGGREAEGRGPLQGAQGGGWGGGRVGEERDGPPWLGPGAGPRRAIWQRPATH